MKPTNNVFSPNQISLGFMDRAIGVFRPRHINHKIQQQFVVRALNELFERGAFKASERTRHNNNWLASESDINSVLQAELQTMRARSRWLVRNNPYAKSAVNTFLNYCVGVGFELQMGVGKTVLIDGEYEVQELEAYNEYIEDKFREWCDDVNIASSESSPDSFSDMQYMGFQRIIEDGEVFIHLKPDRTKILQLDFVEPEALDTFKTKYKNNPIIMGVEVDRITWKPVAYWVRSANPNNVGYVWESDSVRIPAQNMIHCFVRQYPRQMRGLPWFHAVTEKLFQLDEYSNAQLIRNKIASLFGVLFESAGANAGGMKTDQDTDNNGTAGFPVDGNGNPITNLAPGIMGTVPGKPFLINPTAPEMSYDMFIKSGLISIAAGVQFGQSYQGMTRDTTGVTFAGGRLSSLMDMQSFAPIQRLLGRKQYSPIFRSWFDLSVMAGDLLDGAARTDYSINPKFWTKHTWLHGGWPLGVNPVQEVTAAKDSMGARITTLANECAMRGLDWRVQLRGASRIEKFAKKLGLKLYVDAGPEQFGNDADLLKNPNNLPVEE